MALKYDLNNDRTLTIETVSLCIMAAALPFSVTLIQGGLLLFIAAGLYRRARAHTLGSLGTELRATPLLPQWLIYLAAAALATIFAVSVKKSLSGLNSDLFRAIAYFSFFIFLRPKARNTALNVYLFAVAIAAVWGIAQSLYGLTHGLDVRAHGTDHPVRYGEIMAIGLSLALSRISYPKNLHPTTKKLTIAVVILIASAIALSQTRGSYIGTVLIFTTILIAHKESRRAITALLAAAALVGLCLGLLNPTLRFKVQSIFHGANSAITDTAAPDQSIGTRLALWKTGFKIIKDHPLTGVGMNNVKALFPQYCPPPYPENKVWGSLHNLYINQAAERGLIGLAALLLLFLSMLYLAIARYRKAPSALTLWALAIMPAWLQMNLTEITFQHVHTSYAVLLALAIALTSERA